MWRTVQRVLATCCLALGSQCLFMHLSPAASAQGPLYANPTDRFGAVLVWNFGRITDYDVSSLRIGWYLDLGKSLSPLRPGGIEYAQLIWISEGTFSTPVDELGPMIDANPGYLWIIGNEPECIGQGNSTPEQYADVYHELYAFIKGRDPSAQIAIGGIVQPTPLRLKWLDRALGYYQATYGEPMPVDVWNIHNMILQELRGGWGCGIPQGLTEDSGRLYRVSDNDSLHYFVQHIVDFRTWMRDRGERDKPLIITEYGVLMPVQYGFTAERVNAYMNATFDYLLTARDDDLGFPGDENRLVQRWLWYSLNDKPYDLISRTGFNGALFDYRYRAYPGVLTEMGINFREYTNALALTPTATPTPLVTPTRHAIILPVVIHNWPSSHSDAAFQPACNGCSHE
jgi:hypothetical protein